MNILQIAYAVRHFGWLCLYGVGIWLIFQLDLPTWYLIPALFFFVTQAIATIPPSTEKIVKDLSDTPWFTTVIQGAHALMCVALLLVVRHSPEVFSSGMSEWQFWPLIIIGAGSLVQCWLAFQFTRRSAT